MRNVGNGYRKLVLENVSDRWATTGRVRENLSFSACNLHHYHEALGILLLDYQQQ